MAEVKDSLNSETTFKKVLLSLKKLIQPIEISKLKQILDLSKDCHEKVEDQFTFLLLGCTGAGKTTFLQYMCGIDLEL